MKFFLFSLTVPVILRSIPPRLKAKFPEREFGVWPNLEQSWAIQSSWISPESKTRWRRTTSSPNKKSSVSTIKVKNLQFLVFFTAKMQNECQSDELLVTFLTSYWKYNLK